MPLYDSSDSIINCAMNFNLFKEETNFWISGVDWRNYFLNFKYEYFSTKKNK